MVVELVGGPARGSLGLRLRGHYAKLAGRGGAVEASLRLGFALGIGAIPLAASLRSSLPGSTLPCYLIMSYQYQKAMRSQPGVTWAKSPPSHLDNNYAKPVR